MEQKEINRILREYKDVFDALEKYDETGKLPKQFKNSLEDVKMGKIKRVA
jgi:hypothetical protein